MNGGKKCEGWVVEGQTAPVQVPMGWQRRVDPSGVHYISPSGSVLSSLDQVKTYLLTDGTCKCGLECPLTLPKVFNFDPGAAVKQRTADDVRADEDVTKLCIHKRKLLAVATLHKSVKAMAPARFTAQRAIRNKPYETAPPNSVVPDCKNPFRMMMQHHHHQQQQQQQRHHYPPELGGAQMQQELYPGYPRQQQQRMSNSSEPGPRSPYRGGYGAMLSPTPSSGSSHHFLYGDGGSLSPRTDLMGSPLGHHNPPSSSSFSFPGGAAATSPGGRTPLSPPGMLRLHSSSPGATAQLSCAVMAAAGRTSTPLSPTATAKSPVMTNKARGGAGFAPPPMNAAAFHHKTPPHPHPAPSPGAPPPCALQRKQTSSEKDPLGILDPILSKPPPSSSSNPPGYQPSGVLLSQVPAMNVTIPPAIVPLPSNLPLPTVKPGGHVHVQRTQQAAALSPSPVTSPGHAGAGPGPPLGGGGRTEASPHRSRSSSTSSDHGGSFAVPQAAAGGGGVGGVKAPPHPRSPRSVVGSPRPAMPSSPSSSSSNARPSDALHLHHQYKDAPGQLLSGMSGGGAQHNPMYPPPPTTGGTGAGGPPQAMQGHPGLLGMPLNQILSKQNAASFPASSLLSAAAKAQLANQNKQSANNNNNNGGGMSVGGGTGSGHPGPLGGARSVEAGHGTLNPMLPPNSAALLAAPEGGGAVQSGRAALRDKLMAQQRERDPLRKRKQPGNSGAASANHDSVILNMLGGKPGMMGNGGPSSRSPLAAAEQLRKAGRLGGGLPPNASMAQLLQSMSGQNSHMSAGNHRLQNSHPAGPGPMHYPGDGPMAHQGAAQQRLLHGQAGEGLHCQRTDPGPHGQFPGMMMTQMQAGPLAGCGPLSSGGPPDGLPLGHHSHNNTNPPPPPLSHPGQPQHPHSQNHVGTLGRSGLSRMALNGNEESGDPSSLSCGVSNPQLGVLQAHHHNHHHLHPHHHHHHGGSNGGQMYPQHSQGQQQQQQHLHHHPGFQGAQAYPDLPLQDNGSSGSMACLYQNYQQSCLPENVPLTQMSSQAGMTSLPETQGGMLSHPQFGEGMLGTDRLPGGGGGGGTESVDAIYRAVVDAASKGMHVVITATVSGVTQSGPAPSLSAMSAFGGGSVAGEGGPVGLPHHAAVQHARLPRQARPGRPQKTPEHGTGGAADAPEAHDYFRSPQGAGQWDGSGVGGEVHGGLDGHGGGPWGGGGGSGEEFLECSTQVRSGPCAAAPAPPPSCPPEAPHDHGLLPAAASDKGGFLEDAFRFGNNCVRMPLNYKERLEQTVERCAQMNGGFQFSTVGRGGGYGVDVLGPPRHELTGDDQSPGSSTSLEGPLPPVAREYAHYGNGHFNGHCAPSPSDTKSLSSEEELRHPDSPSSSSSELLHYRPARGSFHVGELVWGGQLKGFPPWPAKLAGEEQQLHHHHHHHHHHHGAGGPLRDQGKVEAEKRKTLTHDLEALDRATKRSRKSGKLNNHLEAAIHEAMSELDKMSGTVHQLPSRDRQAKVPKPKRRKISR